MVGGGFCCGGAAVGAPVRVTGACPGPCGLPWQGPLAQEELAPGCAAVPGTFGQLVLLLVGRWMAGELCEGLGQLVLEVVAKAARGGREGSGWGRSEKAVWGAVARAETSGGDL